MRTIKCAPGIGDNIWLFQKLINQSEQFNFQISDKEPQRGKQIFDLLPQVSASCTYVPNLPYRIIKRNNAVHIMREFKRMHMNELYLSANQHLEEGKRIEEFLPDLRTSFTLNYATRTQDKQIATGLIQAGGKYIGIYGSAYSTQRAWDGWNEHKWFEFMSAIHAVDKDIIFVVIGADFDSDHGSNIIKMILSNPSMRFVNTIGQPLSVVIEILKRLVYFVGFPSGLSILNETLGKDGWMMYPTALRKMINTWAAPERIAEGNYKGALFCEPVEVFNWIKNVYKLFDRV